MSNNNGNCLQIVLSGLSLQQQEFYGGSPEDAWGLLHKY